MVEEKITVALYYSNFITKQGLTQAKSGPRTRFSVSKSVEARPKQVVTSKRNPGLEQSRRLFVFLFGKQQNRQWWYKRPCSLR